MYKLFRSLRWAVLLIVLTMLALVGCGGGSHHAAAPSKMAQANKHLASVVQNPVHASPGFGKLAHQFGASVPASSAPTFLMYDDVTVSAIPGGATAVGCYAAGSFANCGSMAARFPKAARVPIVPSASDVLGTLLGQHIRMLILDIEPGDARPDQAGGFALAEMRLGVIPGFYESISTIPAVEANLAATLGSNWRSRVFLWDAFWTGSPHLDACCDATQWFGGNIIDKSQATRAFLGLLPPPPPGPTPAQLNSWRQARNANFHDYHKRGCKSGLQAYPCSFFAKEIVHYQGLLWAAHPEWKWTCWGKGARTKTAVCWIARPDVSIWSQKRDSTARAQSRNRCVVPASFGVPSHSRLCQKLDQRELWFEDHVKAAQRNVLLAV